MSPIDRRMFYHVNWRLVGVLAALFAIGVLNLDASRLEGMVVNVRDSFERVNQFMNMA